MSYGPGIVPGYGKKILRYCASCKRSHVVKRVLGVLIRPAKCKAK